MGEGPVQRGEILVYRFDDDGRVPNSPLPLLVYRQAVATSADAAAALERRFAANGWVGSWRNGIYPFHHYHSNAHEVLGIARGSARVRFGGQAGSTLELHEGDVAVLPAGTGHKNKGASGDLLVVGAYPAGQEDWDLCRGRLEEHRVALGRIAAVPLPWADPLHGPDGPLLGHWRPPRPAP